MDDESEVTLTVDEFVDYCGTQAGLLWGKIQTLNDDVLDLLDEIDTEVAELQDSLDDSEGSVGDALSATDGSGDLDVTELERKQDEIRRKQERVETDQARIRRMKDLAEGYEQLAADLDSEAADGQVALSRVLRFEVDHDVIEYFPDRKTMVEVAADARGDDPAGEGADGENGGQED